MSVLSNIGSKSGTHSEGDDDGRWFRANLFSIVVCFMCAAAAFKAVHSGHSYMSWFVPVAYVGIWRTLNKLRGRFITLRRDNAAAFDAISSDLRQLSWSMNFTIVLVVILFTAQA